MGVLALAILALAVVTAVRSGISFDSIAWMPMAGAFLISMASPALAAMEYRLGIRLAGTDTRWTTAIQVSLFASIANFLPLPAGFAVRLKAMTEQGAGPKKALGASALIGLAWMAMSVLLLGLMLDGTARTVCLVAAAALALLTGALFITGGFSWSLLLPLTLLELLFIASAAIRFWLVFTGLGIPLTTQQAIALAASGPIAAAVGVIPGALGVLEGTSAAIAALAGLPASSGFLASVVLRIFGALAILVWTPILRVDPAGSQTPSGRSGPFQR